MNNLLPIFVLISIIGVATIISKLMLACDRIKDIHEWIQKESDDE